MPYSEVSRHDTAALQALLDATYASFDDEALSGVAGAWLSHAHKSSKLGISDVLCEEASDAVTRTAHRLGIMAARERHRFTDASGEVASHYITSLGPLAALPNESDLVICLTWGQFNPGYYNDPRNPGSGRPFIGERGEIADLPIDYAAFAAQTIMERQIVYRRQEDFRLPYLWLPANPDEVARGIVIPGEIE